MSNLKNPEKTKKADKLTGLIDAILLRSVQHPYELYDAFELVRNIREIDSVEVDGLPVYDKDYLNLSMDYSKRIRIATAAWIKNPKYACNEAVQLYKNTLLFEAPYVFDSYCRYLEWDRQPDKKFYEPRRKQLKPIADEMQRLDDGELDLLAVSLPPGIGKALANDTPILTRNGWKNHGNLVVGDEVVGLDGRFKKVIAVHPKCMLDCLVEFTNGEKIQCHENHEWLIHDRARHEDRDYIAETKRLEKRALNSGAEPGHRGHRYTIQLPKAGYVVGEEKELPLDPYTLGVWLGDGTNQHPRICCDKKDRAVIDRIQKIYPAKREWVHKTTGVLYFDFDFRKNLRQLGLCHNKRRIEKFIPVEYLTASIKQRLELLAGLIDTDGTKNERKYAFTTAEEPLRDTFIELVSTFGWRVCVVKVEPRTSSSGIVSRKPHYIIQFTPDCIIPCELERKKIIDPPQQRAIGFKSITRVEPKEGNCITVEGDGMYRAGKTMIPTHNTTLAIFDLTWVGGRHPDKTILGGSHSNSFLRGVYDELIRILTGNGGEYLYSDVFPASDICNTNAKDMRIDLGKRKRFETFEFSSIGSGNAGKVRASQLLYCDDLVDGIETAMSKERLDKLWQMYYTDLRQRKIGNAAELHIATRWSIYDVIGQLEMQYADDPRAKFIVVPALDENDESQFDYPYSLGFTTEFYHKQRDIMDDPSWKALYMGEPIERDGVLFAPDELRRYFTLPESEPDAILAVCDTKDAGLDYYAMPIAYQYGTDFYIDKIICDNGKPEIVEERIVQELVNRKVKSCRFESNRGATRNAEAVQREVKKRGGITHITTKWNEANKEARIIHDSPYIKAHFLFKDESAYDKEYRTAMAFLTNYTMGGNNKRKHDDVPDSLSMLADFIQSFEFSHAEVVRRWF